MLWSLERLPLSLCLGPEMGSRTEPHIRLCTQRGARLSFVSPSPSSLHAVLCTLSFSKKQKRREKSKPGGVSGPEAHAP